MNLKGIFFFIIAAGLVSCQDINTVADTNKEINGRNWSYTEKLQIPVEIKSAGIPYNLYFNLRHTSSYKYSNIFILIHTTGPDRKRITERREFKLALPDGEWLGSGSGDLYSYQLLFKENHRFPAAGTYTFELEQNMRDNPLDGVSDAGIRIEKADLR